MKKSMFVFLLVLFFPLAAQATLLQPSEAPSSLELLPPPPSQHSKAFAADEAVAEAKFLHHHNKQRWLQAQRDADLSSPQAVLDDFSQAFGRPLSKKQTPAIYQIVQEIMQDEPLVTNSAKSHYARTRPFMYFHTHTCAPQWDHFLVHNGSYPSGHTTIGWATALVLAEINPARENQILKRGFEYGQSRVICGAHWQSDVNEGRVTGSILVARLHAKKGFQLLVQQAVAGKVQSKN
jgi:acid phosphatase (class A)